ncbi:biotin--[acetyl-CoA-carboxylase] ligase [soil metagenome]|jgi:BirA family biotin operon repressor/biotin-[acetyl-CoA-carboxylase] ligase|nr:biotin--[acetyl-CoA-carboxylase] ligase [Acidobacteriota bacterium]
MNFTILRFDSIESTNSEALRQAKLGADEGLCIIANEQTKGRGRHGRVWNSEKNAGLYFSIILRPKIEIRFLPLLTLMSAVAVTDVLRQTFGLNPDIKWANDIHVNEKKICGILAEAIETKKGLAVIVGIGINLKSSNFPPEFAESATSIGAETNKIPNLEKLLENLTAKFANYYEIFKSENGAEKIRQQWTRRSSYAFGKEVRAVLTNETVYGKTCGIEENGALRIQTENREIKIIQAGEVEMLRKIP